jgi:hypothetical protein
VPVQVPSLEIVRVAPSRAVPDSAGAIVLTGGAAVTRSLAGETAVAEPALFVAVTARRSVLPTSAAVAA